MLEPYPVNKNNRKRGGREWRKTTRILWEDYKEMRDSLEQVDICLAAVALWKRLQEAVLVIGMPRLSKGD
jgi:hypothetical protein